MLSTDGILREHGPMSNDGGASSQGAGSAGGANEGLQEAPAGAAGTEQVELAGAASTDVKTHRFRFDGTGSEYFKIWIVNVVLTVLTLGVYSAWAKVRTKGYFYRNTFVDGSSFEYLAEPLNILKGRLIVGALLVAAYVAQSFSQTVYLAVIAVFVLLSPAMMALSVAFNARNSAYRNVTFGFAGDIAGAYRAVFLGGLIYVVTLGLGLPVMQRMLVRYFFANHRYGKLRFQWDVGLGRFYKVYGIGFAIVLFGAIAALTVSALTMGGLLHRPADVGMLGVTFSVLGFYMSMLLAVGYVQAELTNEVVGGVAVGQHKLKADLEPLPMIWLILSNALAVSLTFGLFFPWAKVRLARYRLEHLILEQHGDFIVAADPDGGSPGALGEAAVDLGDLDFDFGF